MIILVKERENGFISLITGLMKRTILCLIFSLVAVYVDAQTKKISSEYNHFINLDSVYSLATSKNWSKLKLVSQNLLFINTETGETKEIDFPEGSTIETQHVKIDSLKINIVLVIAKAIDLDMNDKINRKDPKQIYAYSLSGEKLCQFTKNAYSVIAWNINRYTGTLMVSGYYDYNTNGKKDSEEKNDILLYDLRTLKLKKRL